MAISNERLKEIEWLANEFFVSKNASVIVIADNLYTYYYLAEMLCNNLPKFENDEGYKFNPRTFTRKTPFENFKIISDFYKAYDIHFDIDKLVNDGTISLIYSDYKNISQGHYYSIKGRTLIDSCNNGLVTDSITLVHELSHFRNQINGCRTIAGDLLTETIAVIEELLFLDYLDQIGYAYESEIFKKYIQNLSLKLAKEMKIIFKFGLLYKEIGSLSKDSYKLFYGTLDSYETEIEVVDNYIKSGGNPKKDAEYIMAYALSIYMYDNYKANSLFIENIENLHEMINTHSMLECFSSINLGDLSEQYLEKINLALTRIKKNSN